MLAHGVQVERVLKIEGAVPVAVKNKPIGPDGPIAGGRPLRVALGFQKVNQGPQMRRAGIL